MSADYILAIPQYCTLEVPDIHSDIIVSLLHGIYSLPQLLKYFASRWCGSRKPTLLRSHECPWLCQSLCPQRQSLHLVYIVTTHSLVVILQTEYTTISTSLPIQLRESYLCKGQYVFPNPLVLIMFFFLPQRFLDKVFPSIGIPLSNHFGVKARLSNIRENCNFIQKYQFHCTSEIKEFSSFQPDFSFD